MIICYRSGLLPVSEGWGRYCFHRCVSVHTWGGQLPHTLSHNTATGSLSFLGVPHLYPIIVPLVPCPFQGVPSTRQRYPSPRCRGTQVPGRDTPVPGGVPQSQVQGISQSQERVLQSQTGGTLVPGGVYPVPVGEYLSPRWRCPCPGVPLCPGQDWVSPQTGQDRAGIPPGQDWGTPLTEQQSEYFLPGRQYASCIHARRTVLFDVT